MVHEVYPHQISDMNVPSQSHGREIEKLSVYWVYSFLDPFSEDLGVPEIDLNI